MAKPNYQFAKRQRDLAKKEKKEQKRLKKAVPGEPGEPGEPGLPSTDGDVAVSDTSIEATPENKQATG